MDLPSLLKQVLPTYGTIQSFAQALDMQPSALNRVILGRFRTLSVINCLKLADVAGRSADEILRAAGKGQVADLLTRLYGAEGDHLSRDERALVAYWRTLTATPQRAWMTLLTWASTPSRSPRTGGSTLNVPASAAPKRKRRSG